ncbi:MAG: hypothetical protein HY902_00410, partial [Deltaproteobacteria bacterium]|nr:hypothetical protein [Deltaproteobacteria bacterium]
PPDAEPDTAIGPETVVPITSCASHCGVYLENNDCHCHESCLGDGSCCSDFMAVCGCKNDAACDDGNDCTTDTCKASGYCFQQPMKSCCLQDTECSGGDACHTPKCISGTCTLQPMDCDDGIDCSQDYCDAGTCQHKTAATQCLIDGLCHKAGDQEPDSGGCATCDPAKNQSGWTAKAGMCAVGGECVKSGVAKSPTETCAVCDPSKSTTDWSVKSGTCLIDGACYTSGQANASSECQVCVPATSATGWSGKAGTCSIDGTCYKAGDKDPANACRSCDPTKSTAAWSVAAGYCFIDGVCVASGGKEPSSGGCKVCDTKTPGAWTQKVAGTSCSAGSSCITGAKCDAAGACSGTKAPNCCVTDDDCAGDPSLSPEACQFKGCDKVTTKCLLKQTPGCCTTGVCCDVSSMTFKPVNTVCGTMKQGEEYKCDGATVLKRLIYAGCTGNSASQCYSSTPGYGEWTVSLTCSVGDTCVPNGTGMPSCKPQ